MVEIFLLSLLYLDIYSKVPGCRMSVYIFVSIVMVSLADVFQLHSGSEYGKFQLALC